MIRLITFSLSQYCEKARWALDWHGIAFEEVGWPPGLHMALARRLGAPRSSLPILQAGDELVQGSDAIITWAEQHGTSGRRSLIPGGDPPAAQEIEQRADDVLGVHVRRLFYAEVLPHQPHLAKPWLFANTAPLHRLMGNLMWPAVRKRMIEAMDARPEAAPDSRARVEAELDWLEGKLAGDRFLAGDHFSRVDLTVAALLAPFARPQEAETYSAVQFPPALAGDVERWRGRPAIEWVKSLYRDYRRPRGDDTPDD